MSSAAWSSSQFGRCSGSVPDLQKAREASRGPRLQGPRNDMHADRGGQEVLGTGPA
jgi:hypothetical protein